MIFGFGVVGVGDGGLAADFVVVVGGDFGGVEDGDAER